MAKHTPSIPTPYHQPADDYGGIEAGVSQCTSHNAPINRLLPQHPKISLASLQRLVKTVATIKATQSSEDALSCPSDTSPPACLPAESEEPVGPPAPAKSPPPDVCGQSDVGAAPEDPIQAGGAS